MTRSPRTFTFYSYKGGVGRSMALWNVAHTLHTLGRHVLVVDLDLEAPGISGFMHRNEELALAPEGAGDVLDLLTAVLTLAQWDLGSTSRPALPPLTPYLREVKPEKYADQRNRNFLRPRLDVLCADEARDYTERLAGLKISSLNADEIANAGNLLRELFYTHRFPWKWLENEADQPTSYDYVLIDSRTGFTETGGLCIGPLADRLIIFCGLNDQNIEGTGQFLKTVGLTPRAGSRTQTWDEDDSLDPKVQPATLGEKPAIIVASPVPYGEMETKKARFQKMKEKLGVAPAASISYHPRLSVIETVFCRDGKEEAITSQYDQLTELTMRMIGDHSSQMIERLMRTRPLEKADISNNTLRQFAVCANAQEIESLASNFRWAADVLTDEAQQESGSKADALFKTGGEKYAAALAMQPDDHQALYNWGSALVVQAKQKSGGEADTLFNAAGEKFQAALAVQLDMHEALNNWGSALAEQARQKSGAEADALSSAAIEKFQAALAIKPDKHATLYNWGSALSDQAMQKSGAEADTFFSAAIEKYQAALAIKPDEHEALNNWGSTLSNQAKQRSGAEADALLSAAIEKYQAALAIKPDKHAALYNWGVDLSEQARQKSGAEADALFSAAIEKYQAALAIKPDKYTALSNWGTILSDQAKQKSGDESEALFSAAEEKFQAALAITADDHGALYNLACLQALRRDAVGCLNYLNQSSRLNHRLTQAKLDSDTDFDLIRTSPEFIAFRSTLPTS